MIEKIIEGDYLIPDLILPKDNHCYQNRKFIQKQFNQLDDNLMDYISYWKEKYYRNGFCDGVQLIVKCFDE